MNDTVLRWWQVVLGLGAVALLAVALYLTTSGPSVTFADLGPDDDNEATVSCERGGNETYGGDGVAWHFEVTDGERYLSGNKYGAFAQEQVAGANEACDRAITDRLRLGTWILAGALTAGFGAALIGMWRRLDGRLDARTARSPLP